MTVPSRAVRQLLKDLQLAGLSHLPRSERPLELPVPMVQEIVEAPEIVETPEQTAEPNVPAVELPVEPPRPKPPIRPPVVTSVRTAPNLVASSASREERQARLDELSVCVAGCRRCPHLAATRTQTVFGIGNPQARVMFIGEAPGADEDAAGIPFVGKAGQLLTKIIEACGWKRDDIYICNVLRCRPPGNRTPNEEEANNCREYLDGQIATVDPDYIVCWGSCAAQNLLSSNEAIGKMRQQFFSYGRAKVLCTYHPSYLLRNPAAKKPVWDDMKFLLAEMGQTPPGS